MMTDNRVKLRRRVLKTGKIVFAQGACMLDCTIKNISDRGAMLQIENSMSVPDEFQLYEPSALLLHEVRVVRRANRVVGVAITATRSLAESVDPRLRRLRTMQ
jgi:hypothetical protein